MCFGVDGDNSEEDGAVEGNSEKEKDGGKRETGIEKCGRSST